MTITNEEFLKGCIQFWKDECKRLQEENTELQREIWSLRDPENKRFDEIFGEEK